MSKVKSTVSNFVSDRYTVLAKTHECKITSVTGILEWERPVTITFTGIDGRLAYARLNMQDAERLFFGLAGVFAKFKAEEGGK